MKDTQPLAGKLCEEQKPVRKGVPGFVLDGGTAVQRVVDDGRWEIDDLVAIREEPGKGIILFADFKRRAAAEALVEESLDGQRASAECHVRATAQAAESSDLEPVPILVAEGARVLMECIGILKVGRNDTAGGRAGSHVCKRR